MNDAENIVLVITMLLVAWIGTIILEFIYSEYKRVSYMQGIHEWKKIKHRWRGGDPGGKAQSIPQEGNTQGNAHSPSSQEARRRRSEDQ
jgi:hypothetical protein